MTDPNPKNPKPRYVLMGPDEVITRKYPESALNPPPPPEHVRRIIAANLERTLRAHGWTPGWPHWPER